MKPFAIDPKLDLVFERTAAVSPQMIWDAWTQPEQLQQWFTPAPWKTVECEIDLHPGGMFRTVMLSPEGEKHPNIGCYLEIVKDKKLTWTNALQPGFRPAANVGLMGFAFTATIMLEPIASGTKYTAVVIHNNVDDRQKHEEMGFQDGWGKAFEQLLSMIKLKQS
jgi:uncharacterized protein YndB with AHSA1/START domain